MLKGKTVVVGVCGGIAAYKVIEVVRRLRKLEAAAHVIMTDNAAKFVTALTFQSISHNPVVTDMFAETGKWDIQHISLAEKADLMLIAPATANIIGKIANGIADDMLTTAVMATKAPVLFAPAMNTAMYENPVLQNNISRLKNLGYLFLEPDTGMLACGIEGKGRLPGTETIIRDITGLLYPKKDMAGIKALVTAGPTREPIDPVRYITNRSSGKMGYAVAEAAFLRGAEVKLISGPVHLQKPCNIDVTYVNSAVDMYEAVMKQYTDCSVLIMTAAVADYRCAAVSDKKIKKDADKLTVELARNPDIAEELGKIKGERILVGMCAETDDLVDNARAKLISKNMDMIAANDVTMEGAGFEVDTNIIKILKRDGTVIELPLMGKNEAAHSILDEVVKLIPPHAVEFAVHSC